MKNILLIQTGGTIAMHTGNQGAELDVDVWQNVLYREIPELGNLAHIHPYALFFEDSSDLNSLHWIELAAAIEQQYNAYDGFVILHGTDTMAYTASALSFALANLDKPVIFTGSQLPMSSRRSDARRNLVNAIELATMGFSEVGICFNDALFRANRTTKMSIGDFDAFASPNFHPLADIGIKIEVQEFHRFGNGAFQNKAAFSDDVFVLTMHPNLNTHILDSINLDNIRAIIIRAYGSGNFPRKGPYNLLPFLEKCREKEVVTVIVSQADFDAVDLTQYPAGREALKFGVLSGGLMTLEAALTKLMFLLAHYESKHDIEQQFVRSLAGEF